MDKFLYKKWLAEKITDLPTTFLSNGIDGLLFLYEKWLKDNNYLHVENEQAIEADERNLCPFCDKYALDELGMCQACGKLTRPFAP